ncbi:hypothetical protein, partial [Mesorhizobium sp. M7A.F.Ca.US.010.02.1.1]|uniref:hypothetical protein n=1 Tax=Mesorhizobium sp. M7A.F.Ca.US.010.02.1.1 TaxID=2496743 RepID=UPI0019D46BD0
GARNKAKPKLRDKKPNPVPRKPICTKQQSPRHQPAGRSHSGDCRSFSEYAGWSEGCRKPTQQQTSWLSDMESVTPRPE